MENRKPTAKLIGEDGNIFNLMAIASKALRQDGQHEQSQAMIREVTKCSSYSEALTIIGHYVDIQ